MTTPAPPVLVTLTEAREYLGGPSTAHNAEITRYVGASLGVIENMAGPALVRRTFTERVTVGVNLLRRYPVVSVVSLTVGSTVLPAADLTGSVVDGELGSVTLPQAGTVVYTAGLDPVPDEAVDAALVYISYKYRRNHGGSESYMPAGVDGGVAPPMGTKALHDQIRLALGPYARGPVIA